MKKALYNLYTNKFGLVLKKTLSRILLKWKHFKKWKYVKVMEV